MTEVQELASFVADAKTAWLSDEARDELKKRVLDSLGVAIAATKAEPVEMVRAHTEEFGGAPLTTLIGGGKSAPDRAAFYNGALVRYLDFMDSYLAEGETNHPSDNLAPVLAAAEYAEASGDDLLGALAVAYQVHTRLSDVAPVRAKGFDHTTQGAYAVAAGAAKALGLDVGRTAHAIAISGTSNIALRVTRTGSLSHWKGLAYPSTAFIGTHAAFLAKHGITGPAEVFEGNKGFKDTIAGPFEIDWRQEDLERVRRTIIKKYNAEIHAQAAIEGARDLQRQHGFSGSDVKEVEIGIFDVAYDIIGGGEEGDKTTVHTKEEADHSLPWLVAVALLDGEVLPAQYEDGRIERDDVQSLLRRVTVRPRDDYSARFPDEMPTTVSIELKDGRGPRIDKADYEGFFTRPMSWDAVIEKFTKLTEPFTGEAQRAAIIEAVQDLERIRVRDLTAKLAALARIRGEDR